MIDKNVILDKASGIERHLKRIESKRGIALDEFLNDIDLQDILLFNLQVAIQNCIDMASHIISDDNLGIAGSTSEIFYLLQKNNYLKAELTGKVIAAVGLRNLLVHEYGNLDLKKVYKIIQDDINDLREFITSILKKCGLE
jgi:uncharacterized protein YutE (UPF0331/DUF86 family)